MLTGKGRSPRKSLLRTSSPEFKSKISPGKSNPSKEKRKSSAKKTRGRKSDETEKLFSGLNFLITQGAGRISGLFMEKEIGEKEKFKKTQKEEKKKDPKVEKKPFNQSQLIAVIEEHGGVVLSDFPSNADEMPETLILLSDKPYTTKNFLMAVVYGLTKLNYKWIYDCVASKEKLPVKEYLLFSGRDIGYGRPVKSYVFDTPLTKLMKDKHISLSVSEKESYESWEPLVASLGVRKVSKFHSDIDADVVISDRSAPYFDFQKARNKIVPIVTPNWLINSVINGYSLGYGRFIA